MDRKLKNVQSKHKETECPAEQNDSELAIIKEELKDKKSKLTVAENNLRIANSRVEAQETSMKEADDEIEKLKSELIQVKKDLKASEDAIGDIESDCKKLQKDLTAEKEKIKRMDSDLTKAKQDLEAQKETIKIMDSDLTKAKQDLGAAEETIKSRDSDLTKAKQDLGAADETIKSRDSDLTKAKQDLEAAETERKGKETMLTEANKELRKKDQALEMMDASLAAKSMDGLSWLLFSVKFTLEATLAGLEFAANKDSGMKFLIASIVIASLALFFNGWEVVRRWKEKKVRVNHKIRWSEVPWLPEIYSFFIILLELAFYILKLWILKPVHVSPYTCLLHICILVQKFTLWQKLKAARAMGDLV